MSQNVSRDPAGMLRMAGASWGWMLTFGILTLLAGIAVVSWPGATVIIIAVLFGIQLFVGGIFRVVYGFADKGESHRALQVVLGLLSLIVGVYCIKHVGVTVAALVLVLGIYWVVVGIVDFFGGIFAHEMPHRGWTIATGILGFIAGVIVLTYPITSVVTLAWILGIWLIVYGIMLTVSSFQVKKAAATAPA